MKTWQACVPASSRFRLLIWNVPMIPINDTQAGTLEIEKSIDIDFEFVLTLSILKGFQLAFSCRCASFDASWSH